MLDLQGIRQNPSYAREAIERRGADTTALDEVLSLDTHHRQIITALDEARSKRNIASKLIGNEKRKPTEQELRELRQLGTAIRDMEHEKDEVQIRLHQVLLTIPNFAAPDVPYGLDESGNLLIETFGTPLSPDHSEPHWDVAPRLGILDLDAGASMSGARFYILKGAGARLNRALATWMLNTNTTEFGYTEVEAPLLVRRETMTGSGNLPKFEDNLYRDKDADLWMLPTAEVALNALHMGRIISPGILPLKYVALTPCFRKEHTAAGRDVRGIKRVHQFQKVEIFRFEEPDRSADALTEMVAEVKTMCARLGLVYRVVQLCTGDIGFQANKTFDIEVWSPGSQEWLEVSSVSACGDFQSRRTFTRYRPSPQESTKFPHTLNGSCLALPRIWIAVIENGLQRDGSVVIPEVLRPYTGFERITQPV